MSNNIIRLSLPCVCICCIIFFSCEKTVILNVKTLDDKLVLNAFIGPDSGSVAIITLSQDPLSQESDFTFIDNATVQLYKNGDYLGTYNNAGSGRYTLDSAVVHAQGGDVFKISASAPGKDEVLAEVTMPQTVAIHEVKIIDTTFISVSYFIYDSLLNIYTTHDTLVPNYQFQISFTDPVSTNYYSLQMSYEDGINKSSVCFTSSDPVFQFDDNYSINGNGGNAFITICDENFFTDISFNGTTKVIDFYIPFFNSDFLIDPHFIFKLKNIDGDFYKYIISSSLQSSEFDNPFAQPAIVFSNIENGFGIFAAYNISIFELDL